MKRLITDTGGRPVKNEDLQLFGQAFDVLEGIMGEMPYTEFIVYGCEISGVSPFDISDGVIYKDGVMYALDGVTGISPPDFILNLSTVENTPREFFDSVTRNTIELSYVSQIGGGTDFNLSTAERFSDIIKPMTDRGDMASADFVDAALTFDNSWHDLDLSAIVPSRAKSVILRVEVTTGSSVSNGTRLDFRKKGNYYAVNVGTIYAFIAVTGATKAYQDITVFMNTDKIVEYRGVKNGTGTTGITVASWSY